MFENSSRLFFTCLNDLFWLKRHLAALCNFFIFSTCVIFFGCSTADLSNRTGTVSFVTAGDIYIARKGGACLGSCPDYEVYLFNDGRVIFRGTSHTKVRGVRRKVIAKEQFEKLQSAIEAADFFRQPEAKGCLTDSPTVWIEVNLGKGFQRRLVDFGCVSDRKNMWSIVELLDRITDVQDWVTSSQ